MVGILFKMGRSAMTRKTWIKVKRGLLTDPRHRRTLGARIWLYLHIIDRADWDKGAVLEWRDEDEADALEMPVRTLRQQRKQLQEDSYITCNQLQHCQEIIIHKWVNPRSYSGKVLNQGDKNLQPSKSEGDTQGDIEGDTQGSRKHVTPSLSSHDHTSQNHEKSAPRARAPLLNNKAVLIFHSLMKRWPNEAQRQEISDVVNNSDLEKWEEILRQWRLSDHNPTNVKGQLDAFCKGGLRSDRTSNGKFTRAADLGRDISQEWSDFIEQQ